MQWLIDIVTEWIVAQGYALQSWVEAKGYLTTAFVNRGDPAVADLTDADLSTDGAWHTIDLSSIVPAGTKAVALFCLIFDDAAQSELSFRTNGNVNNSNLSSLYTQVANIINSADVVVPLDANRNIQYKAANVGWIAIEITVKGWWF